GSPFRSVDGRNSWPEAAIGSLRRGIRGRLDSGPLPVPSTAIYSRTDGVASWQTCFGEDGPRTERIEVVTSHCGIVVNPAVLWAVADRLAQPEGEWSRFEPKGPWRTLYPARGRSPRST